TPLPSGRAPAASVPPLARKAAPPGLSTRAHASSGAHTNRATGTGHHSRPGHQAAITIHQAHLKDHLDNKIAEHKADISPTQAALPGGQPSPGLTACRRSQSHVA